MKRALKLIGVGLLIALIAIQFVPVDRSNPPTTLEISAPAEVLSILKRSCYDCHSHATKWPWYSYVAPVSWLVAHDVEEAREELNFSTWDQYDAKKQAHKIEEIWHEVEEGEMPLTGYLYVHSDATLSDKDKAILKAWAGKQSK